MQDTTTTGCARTEWDNASCAVIPVSRDSSRSGDRPETGTGVAMARIRYLSWGVAAMLVVVAAAVGITAGKVIFGGSGPTSAAGEAAVSDVKVDVITKATESEFWQSMLAGSRKAGDD